jgi:hypothetical protein
MTRLLVVAACGAALVLSACAAGSPAPAQPLGAPGAKSAPAPAATAAPATVAKPIASPAASPVAAAKPGTANQEAASQLPVAQSLGRMVIYTTDIALLAVDLERLPDELGRLALAEGGYVAGVETKSEAGIPGVVVRLKVPPERYERTISSIRNLAVEVRSEKATTQDVTEEFSDAQTQIASLDATHTQLLELMKRAGSVEELLKVQEQAAQVRLQIDRLKGRALALERLSALATITVTAQSASVVLERDYTTARAALRQAEAKRSGLIAQLKRARTADEEASLRDKLGQAELTLQREGARVTTLDQVAKRLSIALPRPDGTVAPATADDTLPLQYLQTRVDLRRAQADQQRIAAALESGGPDTTPEHLQAAILRSNDLSIKLRVIQERAGQVGVALPAITPQEEAAMARIGTVQPNIGAWTLLLLLVPVALGGVWLARRHVHMP